VQDASQTLKDAQLLEKAGLGTRFDVVSAEVELSQAQQRLITANAEQNIARRQLAETLSVSHNTDLSTADAIEEVGTWKLSLPETIVQAFKNRAELEQFLLQREIGEENRTIALSQIRPRVSASATYGLSDDFEDNIGFTDNYSLGLQATWRLFDGGAARASAEQAEKDSQIAETQFANQRNQIRFNVEQAYFGLESNQKNIATASKEVELAQESLRLARLRFQAGVGTQTEVIDAQTQLTTARGNLLSSIIEYNQSYNQLQRQVSNTPDNGLQDLP
jgi:outer membrane factor, OMF family